METNLHRAPTRNDAPLAYAKLEQYIDGARARAGGALQRIMTEVPQDRLIKASSFDFISDPGGVANLAPGVARTEVHSNALSQLCERIDVPLPYVKDLQARQSLWAHSLLAKTLNDHARNVGGETRILTRTVGDSTRAMLSASFKRIDARPGLSTLADLATVRGMVLSDAVATDTRVSVRFISPQVIELTPGEYILLGAGWSNSNYGRGASDFWEFILRLWCLNGAIGESVLRQVHLGRKETDESFAYSERTQRLMNAAEIAQLRDAADQTFGEVRMRDRILQLQAVANTPVNADARAKDLAKRLGKGLAKRVTDAYVRPDVEDLPAGQTMWRWSNALSWVAGHTDDAEERLDLEREAGKALLLPAKVAA